MKEILATYGFTFRGTCTCAGPKTEKYKRGDHTVYWNKRQQMFRIKHYGKPITILLNESKLEENLEKIFPKKAQNTAA